MEFLLKKNQSSYQQMLHCYIVKIFYVRDMVTKKQKPRVDLQNIKTGNQSIHTTTDSHQPIMVSEGRGKRIEHKKWPESN